ncbi:hypothetical protein KKA14_21075, partial [bacterium]|nr:hypothetical protein [bacterium]
MIDLFKASGIIKKIRFYLNSVMPQENMYAGATVLEYLLKSGFDPNQPNQLDMTLLCWATWT